MLPSPVWKLTQETVHTAITSAEADVGDGACCHHQLLQPLPGTYHSVISQLTPAFYDQDPSSPVLTLNQNYMQPIYHIQTSPAPCPQRPFLDFT